ncbi:cytochrome C [Rhodanobacter glycinis]|uniref:Cytochrome C n=1 Tax=Rhodanobacter glycinis TaxID=582702 RepID=A0A502FBP4_9GAMM|nr:cytochrome C [Rhodanobacter glycinis]TPG11383.1 cytochrome C [Rhodanobacter glycinis]TPG46800.1 cytochrome C [Rhodanobacter glycinis]
MSSFPHRWANLRSGIVTLYCSLAALLLFASTAAHAIPVYARQTGSACADCHAGAYGGGGNGPNLTPYGMRFKLNGYTDTDGNGGKIPVSAQLVETHTAPARGESSMNLTEADLYLAGRLTDQVGGYVKVEADRVGHNTYNTKLRNVDLRFVARELKLGGKDLTLGVSVNNSPSFDDPIAVLPAATNLGPPGGQGPTGTFLKLSSANAPAYRVIGATVYGLYDSDWYGEVGTYNSLPTSTQDHLGYSISGDPGKIGDTGYFRFAYMKDLKRQFFSVGVVGLTTRRQLQRRGSSDKLTDLGYDLTYQFLGNRENIVQLSYVNILEKRRYGSTPPDPGTPGFTALPRGALHDETLSVTYTFRQSYGLQLAHLESNGTRDAVRFGPYGNPDTTANLLSVFWAPFGKDDSFTSVANMKIAATWFRFTRFNGATNNIFGAPPGVSTTRPADLDAFLVSASLAF